MPTPPTRTTASTTSQQQTAAKGHPRPRGRAPAGKVWDTRTGEWRSAGRTSGDAAAAATAATAAATEEHGGREDPPLGWALRRAAAHDGGPAAHAPLQLPARVGRCTHAALDLSASKLVSRCHFELSAPFELPGEGRHADAARSAASAAAAEGATAAWARSGGADAAAILGAAARAATAAARGILVPASEEDDDDSGGGSGSGGGGFRADSRGSGASASASASTAAAAAAEPEQGVVFLQRGLNATLVWHRSRRAAPGVKPVWVNAAPNTALVLRDGDFVRLNAAAPGGVRVPIDLELVHVRRRPLRAPPPTPPPQKQKEPRRVASQRAPQSAIPAPPPTPPPALPLLHTEIQLPADDDDDDGSGGGGASASERGSGPAPAAVSAALPRPPTTPALPLTPTVAPTRTAVLTSHVCGQHETGLDHVETPIRLQTAMNHILGLSFDDGEDGDSAAQAFDERALAAALDDGARLRLLQEWQAWQRRRALRPRKPLCIVCPEATAMKHTELAPTHTKQYVNRLREYTADAVAACAAEEDGRNLQSSSEEDDGGGSGGGGSSSSSSSSSRSSSSSSSDDDDDDDDGGGGGDDRDHAKQKNGGGGGGSGGRRGGRTARAPASSRVIFSLDGHGKKKRKKKNGKLQFPSQFPQQPPANGESSGEEEGAEGGDTVMSRHSLAAALAAAGVVCAAVDAVMDFREEARAAVLPRSVANAFCLVRPPGHHAASACCPNEGTGSRNGPAGSFGGGGFCLVNNVVLGARHAREAAARRGVALRVAIFDFDVHHGNGTEDLLRKWPALRVRGALAPTLFCSVHQFNAYAWPGSGATAVPPLSVVPRRPAAQEAARVATRERLAQFQRRREQERAGAGASGGAAAVATAARAPLRRTRAQIAEAGIVLEEDSSSGGGSDGSSGSGSEDEEEDEDENDCRGSNGSIIANVGVPVNSGPVTWRAAVKRMLPLLRRFAPDLLLLSAGFDAHEHDPVGQLTLADEDYAWLTAQLVEAAGTSRVVSVLEGGYGTTPEHKYSLGTACAAHVGALCEAAVATGPVAPPIVEVEAPAAQMPTAAKPSVLGAAAAQQQWYERAGDPAPPKAKAGKATPKAKAGKAKGKPAAAKRKRHAGGGADAAARGGKRSSRGAGAGKAAAAAADVFDYHGAATQAQMALHNNGRENGRSGNSSDSDSDSGNSVF